MAPSKDGAPARPGRRRGPSGTRPLIVKAARELFAEKGFDGTSLRAVARAAGVDPALVHHFFAGKEALFVEAMEFPVDPTRLVPLILQGPREEIGERLVRVFLGLLGDEETRPRLLAIVRSAVTSEQGATMVREFMTAAMLERLAEALAVPPTRVGLVAAQMIGVVMVRYVLEAEPLARATDEELVELLAPVVQRYLD
ncbi:TetR/AcrR family transcriptional regulator [Actinocorallia populi]|uniref:TetR/AcrR family transcriptional regulator n=1 Tax=Actinocorallia populi TaxID=2079200 RepID=UPI000D094DD8|nr:TetR family transcriptional regulator [Actinocorallia populi]